MQLIFLAFRSNFVITQNKKGKKMNNQANYEIDYEDMDDLQIADRIGWNEFSDNEMIPDDQDIEPKDYDTEYHSLNFDHNDE